MSISDSSTDSRFVSFRRGGEKDFFSETPTESSSCSILVRWLCQDFSLAYLLSSIVFMVTGIWGAMLFLDIETAIVVETLADDDAIYSIAESNIGEYRIRRKLLLGIESPRRLIGLLVEIVCLPLASILLLNFAFNSYKSVLVVFDIGRRRLSSVSGYDSNPSVFMKWQWHNAESIMKYCMLVFFMLAVGLIGAAIFTSVTFIDTAAKLVCREKNLCKFVTKTDTR
jgi:hypothetical protein